jgi:hypothetical protein
LRISGLARESVASPVRHDIIEAIKIARRRRGVMKYPSRGSAFANTTRCDHARCDHNASWPWPRTRVLPSTAMRISGGARSAIDQLDKQYRRTELDGRFRMQTELALQRLSKPTPVSDTCVSSVVRVAHTLTGDADVLDINKGGRYLLHAWRRCRTFDEVVRGMLTLDERLALIELATSACIRNGWVGRPRAPFPPLAVPWRKLVKAVIAAPTVADAPAHRWQQLVKTVDARPVESAHMLVSCALAWCGVFDHDDLGDHELASAAAHERRWFTVNRVTGLRLLGQLFLFQSAPGGTP